MKRIMMNRENLSDRIAAWDNIKFCLMITVVVGHLANPYTKNSAFYRSIYLLIYSFHMPLYIYIAGLFHKNTKITEKIVSYLSLYLISKVSFYLLKSFWGGNPSFHLLSEDGIPWFMFAMAAFTFFSYIFRNINKSFLLIMSIILACFAGYDKSIADFLVASRIIVFYPFYILGMMTNRDRLEKILCKKYSKLIGILVLVFWGLLCVFCLDKVYVLRHLFTGRNPFNDVVRSYGFIYRLICYLISFIAGFSFMLAIPTGNLGILTILGQRTLQVYFWHNILRDILVHMHIWENCFSAFPITRILWLLLAIPITLFFSLKCWGIPTNLIMKKSFFQIKQVMKMVLQHIILPLAYDFWCIIDGRKKKRLIIFADARHESIPASMEIIHKEVIRRGHTVVDFFYDFSELSLIQTVFCSLKFMRLYANAGYIFICDNFLPVASCRKRKRTKVIQLWHSCGLMKKIGYDTPEDIPEHYIGNVYKNYDMITVSAPCCVRPLTSGMRQKPGVVKATGVSRTDIYYNEEWISDSRNQFYSMYPEAKNKRIVLWCPTFRGNAAHPYQVGEKDIFELEKKLGDGFFFIRKVHPHVEKIYHLSNCELSTEMLLTVADIMITDYSSTVFDFLFFRKPFVLFAPDLKEYQEKRGFYVDYYSLTPYVASDGQELYEHVMKASCDDNKDWIDKCRNYHNYSCDGHATDRILKLLGL